jgi:Fe-S-cluster containining protein
MTLQFKGKCAGLCCELFPIGIMTYADLQAAFRAWHANEAEYLDHRGEMDRVPQDIWLIYPMARLQSTDEAGRQLFTCAHWDRETHLCQIYDDRPVMCRDFPYRGKCKYHEAGCTLEVVETKEEKHHEDSEATSNAGLVDTSSA